MTIKASVAENELYKKVRRFGDGRKTSKSKDSDVRNARVIQCRATWIELGELAACVKPRGQLTSNVAEAAIEYIKLYDCPDDKVLMSYVVGKKISEGNVKHNVIKAAFSQEIGSKLTRKYIIMFPFIQTWGVGKDKVGHWYTISINTKQRMFEILDSLRGPDNDDLQSHSRVMLAHIKRAWKEHYGGAKLQIEDFTTQHIDVPKQNNLDDCGFYMLEFMRKWDGRVVPALELDDIVELRKVLTYKMIVTQPFNEKKNAKDFIEENTK